MMRTRLISLLSRLLAVLLRGERGKMLPRTPRNILVVKPCCLGDVLLATPLLHTLRVAYPQATITMAVGAWSRPMVASSQDVDAIITIPDRWTIGSLLSVARALRTRHFDMAFVPERTPLPGVLVWLAGIPIRVGLDSRGRGFAYTHPIAVPTTLTHEADLYLSLARGIGLTIQDHRPHFYPTAADRDRAARIVDDLLDHCLIVVLHPGGGSNPGMTLTTKRWLPERWAAVADEVARTRNAQIVLVGSADEYDIAQSVRDAMHAPATIIAQRWQWGTLAALIERATLFLGHDTGMMHLAHAVGTPVVAVYGPSDPQLYGPYSSRTRAVWHPTVESPCFYDGVAPIACPCGGRCMRNVQTAHVMGAIAQVLDGVGRNQQNSQ